MDSQDRAEGTGLKQLPTQRVTRSYKRTMEKDDEKQKKLSFIQDSYKNELEFLEKCKTVRLTSDTIKRFFQSDCSYDFGIGSTITCRVGIEPGKNRYMLYMYRENGNFKPTILRILYSDLPGIVSCLKKVMWDIKEAKSKEQAIPFACDDFQATDIEFWKNKDNVFYSPSGLFRFKVEVTSSKLLYFHFNKPSENSEIENWYGPRLKLVFDEVEQFITMVEDIREQLPPLSIMEDFME